MKYNPLTLVAACVTSITFVSMSIQSDTEPAKSLYTVPYKRDSSNKRSQGVIAVEEGDFYRCVRAIYPSNAMEITTGKGHEPEKYGIIRQNPALLKYVKDRFGKDTYVTVESCSTKNYDYFTRNMASWGGITASSEPTERDKQSSTHVTRQTKKTDEDSLVFPDEQSFISFLADVRRKASCHEARVWQQAIDLAEQNETMTFTLHESRARKSLQAMLDNSLQVRKPSVSIWGSISSYLQSLFVWRRPQPQQPSSQTQPTSQGK